MSPQAIDERAYFIWENMGRPEGQSLGIWLRAQAELAAEAAGIPEPKRRRVRRGRRRTTRKGL